MKTLCVGHIAYGITFPLASYLIENTKNCVYNKIECVVVPVSITSYLLECWRIDVHLALIVGNDLYIHRIKEEFDKVYVNTIYLEISKEHTTTSSKLSNIVGVISITRLGGRSSIPTKEEMGCVYNEFK